jgi:CTP:molybdopterin cytidylyltransferase MocA
MVRVDIQVIKIFDSAAGISTSVESGAMSVEAIIYIATLGDAI